MTLGATLLALNLSGQTLSIATGSPSGLYYPLGGALASIWSKNVAGVNIKAEVTAGSVTNLAQVAKLESDICFSQGDVVANAIQGGGPFPDPLPVAILGKMYPNIVHLVTVKGSGIEKVSDLAGRRVSVGPPGSGNAVTAWNVLNAVNITDGDFSVRQLDYTETTNALKDGTIDAGFISGGLGIAAVMELAVTRDAVLVPFTNEEVASISAKAPAYTAVSVPAGVYKGVDVPVQTPALWSLLMVNASMSPELAYNLLKAVFDHKSQLVQISRVAEFFDPQTAADVAPFPLHPGAKRYYDEVLGNPRRN